MCVCVCVCVCVFVRMFTLGLKSTLTIQNTMVSVSKIKMQEDIRTCTTLVLPRSKQFLTFFHVFKVPN